MIELLIVIAIIGVVASIMQPRYLIFQQKTYQAKSRSNLATLRTVLNVYYSDNDHWPHPYAAEGEKVFVAGTVEPKYIQGLNSPQLFDFAPGYNGFSLIYDDAAAQMWNDSPPKDVVVRNQTAGPLPGVNAPYGYNNRTGDIYVNNFNLDSKGDPFYTW